LYSSNASNELDNNHSHFVIVVNNDLNHNNHLVGTENSKLTIQLSSTILLIIPFLLPSSAITVHSAHAGTEIFTFSIGSIFFQFSSCIITTGAHTCNSNHSLLIVSINTERCNSHLPATS
jgi:hypothetical protein